jgi:hypothetical protein
MGCTFSKSEWYEMDTCTDSIEEPVRAYTRADAVNAVNKTKPRRACHRSREYNTTAYPTTSGLTTAAAYLS